MLTITRNDSLIEVTFDTRKRLSIELGALKGMMLLAERLPCGRIGHALVLANDHGLDPVRVEGTSRELGAIHGYLMDMMLGANPVHVTGSASIH